MNIVTKLSVFALFIAILFSACQKNKLNDLPGEDPNPPTVSKDVSAIFKSMQANSGDTIYIDCVRIPYPISLQQASGSTITVNNEVELDSALTLADSIVDFVYPFQVVTDQGVFTINSIEDLTRILVDCATEYNTECGAEDAHVLLFFNGLNILTLNKYVYEIQYPVTLIVQGNSVVLNDDDDYLPAIGGSPFSYLPTELTYPITVKQFGQSIVLTSDNDVCDFYKTLDEPCGNKPAHIQFFFNEGGGTPINCAYFINYPVDIEMNGVTKTIQDRQDYLNELNSSPSAYGSINLVYPASVTKVKDGQQITFASAADICQYLDNCK